MNALELHDPPWLDVILDEVECSQCHLRKSPATVMPQGWRQMFTKHPSEQEHPLLLCPRCLRDFTPYGQG
jgi:hypothetical protein